MKRTFSFVLPLAAMAVFAFPLVAHAVSSEPIDSAGVQVQQAQQNGIRYLSGGIGLDESRAIQQSSGYNLHMTFAVGTENLYTSDVDVVVQKAAGQPVLSLNQAGPLVYAQLPAGKYTVVATRNGEVRRDVADIGSGPARNLVFHWDWTPTQ